MQSFASHQSVISFQLAFSLQVMFAADKDSWKKKVKGREKKENNSW